MLRKLWLYRMWRRHLLRAPNVCTFSTLFLFCQGGLKFIIRHLQHVDRHNIGDLKMDQMGAGKSKLSENGKYVELPIIFHSLVLRGQSLVHVLYTEPYRNHTWLVCLQVSIYCFRLLGVWRVWGRSRQFFVGMTLFIFVLGHNICCIYTDSHGRAAAW